MTRTGTDYIKKENITPPSFEPQSSLSLEDTISLDNCTIETESHRSMSNSPVKFRCRRTDGQASNWLANDTALDYKNQSIINPNQSFLPRQKVNAAGLILFDCQMAAGGYKNTDQMIINRNAAKMPIEERCNKQQKFGKNETQFEKEDFLNQTMCGKSFVEKLTDYNKKEIELDYEGRNKGKILDSLDNDFEVENERKLNFQQKVDLGSHDERRFWVFDTQKLRSFRDFGFKNSIFNDSTNEYHEDDDLEEIVDLLGQPKPLPFESKNKLNNHSQSTHKSYETNYNQKPRKPRNGQFEDSFSSWKEAPEHFFQFNNPIQNRPVNKIRHRAKISRHSSLSLRPVKSSFSRKKSLMTVRNPRFNSPVKIQGKRDFANFSEEFSTRSSQNNLKRTPLSFTSHQNALNSDGLQGKYFYSGQGLQNGEIALGVPPD